MEKPEASSRRRRNRSTTSCSLEVVRRECRQRVSCAEAQSDIRNEIVRSTRRRSLVFARLCHRRKLLGRHRYARAPCAFGRTNIRMRAPSERAPLRRDRSAGSRADDAACVGTCRARRWHFCPAHGPPIGSNRRAWSRTTGSTSLSHSAFAMASHAVPRGAENQLGRSGVGYS
jgi:hypothetical protein